MIKTTLMVLAVISALLVTVFFTFQWFRPHYPYGWSHACDKVLMLALARYSQDHDGAYPTGDETPEACLGQLYPKYAAAEVLCGKTVPAEITQQHLAAGNLLTPETCGWHYIPGQKATDDPQLALFWDKARLGHNGEQHADGSTAVFSVDGTIRYVAAKDWDQFREQQDQLRRAQPPSVLSSPTDPPRHP